MNFIDKLERKFPRFGITHLMKYVICINVAGAVLGILDASGVFGTSLYASYLSLDYYQIFHGQVWRLVTWLLYPVYSFSGSSMFMNLIWFAIWAFLYFQLGTSLERTWGRFRFNLFYIGGVIFVMLSTLVFYLINCFMNGGLSSEISAWFGWYIGLSATLDYLNQTLFLAFALMYPDARFLLYFVIPVKAKWLAWLYLAILGYQLVRCIIYGAYFGVALIVGALLNFLIFFVFGRGKPGVGARFEQRKRAQEFRRRARPYENTTGQTAGRHRCAICGRTELDAPQLEFRYCSKCKGNYEYCSDHLFSHQHVSN
ncbi:MAG: hypothetical protein J6P16_04045 [Eubacterium sp.]|nr:hypothetical protein [Eubacterium sp.]